MLQQQLQEREALGQKKENNTGLEQNRVLMAPLDHTLAWRFGETPLRPGRHSIPSPCVRWAEQSDPISVVIAAVRFVDPLVQSFQRGLERDAGCFPNPFW
ncbi:hypothetical protein F2P79_015385 [Pimephales promelas]|nr:hypothetical protein F2P79_015385 [Pimephales promelas]